MPTSALTFPAADGTPLSGRLETPEGPPRAQAVFAHCFTCSSRLNLVRRVCAGLAERGIATLRFDFTGLGESGGAFADSHFGRNLEDLAAAAAHLDSIGRPPSLLVGHSLGGAAVLQAAGGLDSVKAVATIAAPADPGHARHLLGDPEFDAEGQADVEIGGRPFRVHRGFVKAMDAAPLEEAASALRKPLLLFHSPGDTTVGIEHAERLYRAARHPKSFVSLGDADHMASRPEDAALIAGVLAAWADRHA